MADIKRARQPRTTETWAKKLMWRWLRSRRFALEELQKRAPHALPDYTQSTEQGK